MGRLVVTMGDIQRYKVMTEVLQKRMALTAASQLLSVSYRHAIRLKQKISAHGLEGILRPTPSVAPNRKITSEITETILKLRKEIYHDFNFMHFRDKLEEVHSIPLSYESVRKILISHNIHKPKKKKIIHRQRRRMPKAGMLVQMDSSQHKWLEHIPEKWWLIAMIDDATNEIPYARLFPGDTLFANMHVIRRFIEMKGTFISLYVDKARHFTTTRYGGLHVNISLEQEDTQIERALRELGINLIPANSPQAKGRIEVTFRLFQDRLIKEMRLAGIENYDEANKFVSERFLPWYNDKYTHEAENAYMSLASGKDLDLIFCVKRQRTVNKDNTISYKGQIIQIPPSNIKLSFAKIKVDLCLLDDKRIFVVYENKIIAQSVVSEDNNDLKEEKKIEELLGKRQYMPVQTRKKPRLVNTPSATHPWRKSDFKKKMQIKQFIRKNRIGMKTQCDIIN
jgi:hypothetical protein